MGWGPKGSVGLLLKVVGGSSGSSSGWARVRYELAAEVMAAAAIALHIIWKADYAD